MNISSFSQQSNYTLEPWRMLGWLFAAQVLVAFVGRSVSPLGVLIGEDLSLTKAQIGMLPAALFFGQMAAAIPAGIVADRIDSRKLLLMLSLCLGCGFLLTTFTSSFVLILLLIALGGVGYGTIHPTSNKGIIYWFDSKKRGTAMGIKQMGVTAGSALAALVLLPVAGTWGWRTAIIGAAVLLIFVGVLSFRFYHEPPSVAERNGSMNRGHFLSSLLNMFKHKPLLLVSLGATGLNGSQLMLNTYIVLFAYQKLGISLFLSGLLLVISDVSGSFGRIGWGVISDRLFYGRRIIILMIIALLTGCVSLLVAFLPADTPFWVMVPVTIMFGFCTSGFNGIWMNAATELVPREQAGAASGFSIMIGSWGTVIGPPLFGFIVDQSGTFSAGWIFLSSIMVFVFFTLLYANMLVKKHGISRQES